MRFLEHIYIPYQSSLILSASRYVRMYLSPSRSLQYNSIFSYLVENRVPVTDAKSPDSRVNRCTARTKEEEKNRSKVISNVYFLFFIVMSIGKKIVMLFFRLPNFRRILYVAKAG